jgi:hypothetical protein
MSQSYRNRSNSDQVDEKDLPHNPKVSSSSQIYDVGSSREEDAVIDSPVASGSKDGGGSGNKRMIELDTLKG